MTTPTPTTTADLPAPLRDFLVALTARDVEAALPALTATATVTDEGRTFRGTDEIRRFLSDAGAEFTFTTELIGVRRDDEGRWVATQRLEGDFPGGVAELDFRFAMEGDLVAELFIG